jgi:hypothetical protein
MPVTAVGYRTPTPDAVPISGSDSRIKSGWLSGYENIVLASEMPGSTWDAKIQAAHTALPPTGGTIDARSLSGSQSMTGSLTISKPGVEILLPNSLQLSMGSNQIIILTTAKGLYFGAPTPCSGASVEHAPSLIFEYTGDGIALQGGDPATFNGPWLNGVEIDNIFIDIYNAGNDAVGMKFFRVANLHLTNPGIFAKTTTHASGNNQIPIWLDGGAGDNPDLDFCEYVIIYNPNISGGSKGIYVTALGGVNASQCIGGTIRTNNTTDGFGFYVDKGEFTIIGTDVESAYQAWTVNNGRLCGYLRTEGCTKSLLLGAGASSCNIVINGGVIDVSAANMTQNLVWAMDNLYIRQESDNYRIGPPTESGGGRIQLLTSGPTFLQGGPGSGVYLNPYGGSGITYFGDGNGGLNKANIDSTGQLTCAKIHKTATSVHADNASALAGGLVAGDEYRTSTGVKMEVY